MIQRATQARASTFGPDWYTGPVDPAGLSSAALSVAWHRLAFSALDFQVCPAGPGNPLGTGFCGASPNPLLPLKAPSINNDLGVVRGIQVAGGGTGQVDTTFTLARISLSKLPFADDGTPGDPAASLFEPYFFPDEGMLDSSGVPISPLVIGAYAGIGDPLQPIVPEPSSALLLAAGLVAFGVRRKRR